MFSCGGYLLGGRSSRQPVPYFEEIGAFGGVAEAPDGRIGAGAGGRVVIREVAFTPPLTT